MFFVLSDQTSILNNHAADSARVCFLLLFPLYYSDMFIMLITSTLEDPDTKPKHKCVLL